MEVKKHGDNVIIEVEPYSIAYEMGVEKGDILLLINYKKVKDVFDYRYLIKDEYLDVLIEKPNGEEWLLEIEKDYDDDLGIVFEQGLMDDAKSCKNKCIFCFVDQLPEGMRDTLYFKDDDTRLSFLQGNYVTLTNMSEEDFERVLFYNLSPINVSVHTTDSELREFMLKNPNSKNLFKYLDKIAETKIEVNFQIVLCKGINDGKYLDKTIEDLVKYMPNAKSMSIVPVGITKYRDNLYPLEPYNKEDARKIIKQVNKHQKRLMEEFGTKFVYLSDEFYILAETDLPDYDYYEDFPQIENGVGMITLFKQDFYKGLHRLRVINNYGDLSKVSLVTGMAAKDTMIELSKAMYDEYNVEVQVFPIVNEFFGETITVSGLLTAQDIIKNLEGIDLGRKLLISSNMLKRDEDIFLDNVSLEELEEILNINIDVVNDIDGEDFINAVLTP